jgi:hypothetical protein
MVSGVGGVNLGEWKEYTEQQLQMRYGEMKKEVHKLLTKLEEAEDLLKEYHVPA